MHDELIKDFSLAGRTAVVTGAASGIGRETARVLAQAGAHVFLVDRDETGLAEAAAEVAEAGGTATVRRTDVSNRADVEALADEAIAATGRVDVWLNAAGVLIHGAILETSERDADWLWSINQKGVFLCCAAAGRVMRGRGEGSIVNLSSGGADMSPPGVSLYCMAKAAVNSLTRTAAHEFGRFGVRVNAVAPGWVDTPMVNRAFRDEAGAIDRQARENAIRGLADMSPLGLIGTPRDIALVVLYLAADAGRYMTGQVIRPNGGVAMGP